ncbi:pre-rRNA-processing protein esf1 [Gaertneriomyces sp. JEL0708]|nr:pre-rRNA-processing protein esf1 [Gaertneriomyces sp. JEL0708]
MAGASGRKNSKGSSRSAKTDDDAAYKVTTDPRFARVHFDPRFIRTKKDDSKIQIDSRFAGMLQSEEFGTGIRAPKVDKYGRPVKTTAEEDLKRFYKLDEEASSSEDENEASDEEALSPAEGEEASDEDIAISGYGFARGEQLVESSDEDEDEEAISAEDSDQNEELSGPYNEEHVPTGEETRRFAIVNLDWDHIRASDLYKVFDAFKPADSAVKCVKIYPSEFGKERLEREAREGPPAELFETSEEEDAAKPLVREDDGTEDYDNIKLRKYQLERLRYYYAVVECDSVQTARAIYQACDGTEYEKSSNFFDLRYVPDDMEFTDKATDEAFEPPAAYQPKDFVTLALQHSKVKLTWDNDDDDRLRVTRRKFTKDDLTDMDFKAYLASASEDEGPDEDAEAIRSKYRNLLTGASDDVFGSKDKEEEMEITFTPGLTEKAEAALKQKETEKSRKDETVFEAYLRKRKEKRKAKKTANKIGEEASDGDESDEPLVSSDGEHLDEDDPFFQNVFDESFAGPGKSSTKSKQQKPQKKGAKKGQPTAEELKAKAELELLMMDENETQNRHFEMKQVIKEEKKQKRKRRGKKSKEEREGGVQDGFQVDVKDPRFAGVLESHHFAIDPTNPQFKKTQGMETILTERRKRREAGDSKSQHQKTAQEKPKNSSEAASSNLMQLVESVKRKSAAAVGNQGKRQKKL